MHHEFHIVDVVAGLAGLLLIAAAILAVTKRFRFPFSVALVVVGAGLGALANINETANLLLKNTTLSPGLIFYVFLPTLIFESAFDLDFRQLRHNLGPILTLAVPGLLLSTFLIGGIVGAITEFPFPVALLLGAILSATDPVAVVALFRRLGVPDRLTVLVEGESLFNDATSIVLATLLAGALAASGNTFDTIVSSVVEFFRVFAGGLLVGWILGLATGYLLGKVEGDPSIEITLTTVLAYLSFILAEELLGVSGVMATVAAGLTMGGWGRIKISPAVRTYLEHFWEYMAFVATALIFLMVGLRVEFRELLNSVDLLFWVIIAMLFSRAVVIYGFMPILGRLPGSDPIGIRYQTVMYWGGLRGAIALAIVLSLPEFPQRDTLVILVMGAVIFTLIVQGLTMERLVQRLGLHKPSLLDRFSRVEGDLAAKKRALERIPELSAGGLFSGTIAERLQKESESNLSEVRKERDALQAEELDRERETDLVFLRSLVEEKTYYIDMYTKAHISERALRNILSVINLQIDAIRLTGAHGAVESQHFRRLRWEKALYRRLDAMPPFRKMAEKWRLASIARSYEETWGHYQGNGRVLRYLESLRPLEVVSNECIEEVEGHFRKGYDEARFELDEIAEQYPEFVQSMQERLGRRMLLLAEEESIHEHARRGLLSHAVAEQMEEEVTHKIRQLRGQSVDRLKIGPEELLRMVPFFRNQAQDEFDAIAARMQSRTQGRDEEIIRQGDAGDSLFIIARGVVRVYQSDGDDTRDLATLMAGDFFGEMALLQGEPRIASVRTVTPCTLYMLSRADFNEVMELHPGIRAAVELMERERKAMLETRPGWGSVSSD